MFDLARPIFTALLTTLCAFTVVPVSACAEDSVPANTTLVYVGTYTGQHSDGIYVCQLNAETGELSAPELAAKMDNPSWVTLHPTGKYLFAAGEFGPYPDGGVVSSFAVLPNGKLELTNSQRSNGNGPCHLGIDPTGTTIMVSNYGSGNASSLQVSEDGRLSPSVWRDQYPTINDQKPHAHFAGFDPSNEIALVCDAGLDRIWVYRFDAGQGTLAANDPPFVATTPGTHPRHLVFSDDGRFCYTIDEKSMSVTAFRFDSKAGVLEEMQSISTLPPEFNGLPGSTAELVMHPSGRFLYGSNRGPDNLVCYAVDDRSGKLTLVGHTDTGGKTARSFGIDPSGRWMIVGNQKTNTIVQFTINQATGGLTATGTQFDLGSPVCFQFLETGR